MKRKEKLDKGKNYEIIESALNGKKIFIIFDKLLKSSWNVLIKCWTNI